MLKFLLSTISIKSQFSSCSDVKRFISNGTFGNRDDATNALKNGVVIENLFIMPEPYCYCPAKNPTRCFNCNSYGHVANFCKGEPTCAKCSNQHKTTDCTEVIKKCCI